MSVKIRREDTVKVITGKSKGQEGSVTQVIGDKVVIEGVNIVKKHQKPSQANPQGGIIEEEAPIHISNVKLVGKKAKSDK
ncbi:MAG: 50S ribosomal protein L24 [Fibrobacterales bacterium]